MSPQSSGRPIASSLNPNQQLAALVGAGGGSINNPVHVVLSERKSFLHILCIPVLTVLFASPQRYMAEDRSINSIDFRIRFLYVRPLDSTL